MVWEVRQAIPGLERSLTLRITMTENPRISHRELLHRGKKFDFVRVNLAPAGSQPVWREVVSHPGAVCILPVLKAIQPQTELRIVLIRNHRFAIGGDLGTVLWEIPAGTMEPGEEPGVTAGRELVEEAGYEAGRLERLTSFYTTPGMTDERMAAFLATELRQVPQRLEEDERIEVKVRSVSEVLAMIDRGEIVDGKTVLTILFALRAGLLGSGEERS